MAPNNHGLAPNKSETAPGNSGSALNRSEEKSKTVAASNRDFRTTGRCFSAAGAHTSAHRWNSWADCCCSLGQKSRCCRAGCRCPPRAVDRSSCEHAVTSNSKGLAPGDHPCCAASSAPARSRGGSNCRSLAARGHDPWNSLALPKSANCFRSAAGRCSSRCSSRDSNWALQKADGFAKVRAAALSSRSWPGNSLLVRLLLRSHARRNH